MRYGGGQAALKAGQANVMSVAVLAAQVRMVDYGVTGLTKVQAA